MGRNSRTLIAALVGLSALPAAAQMSFSIDLNAYPKIYNPVPLRDTIPSTIVRTQQNRIHITIIPAAPVTNPAVVSSPSAASPSATAETPKLTLSPRPSAFNNRIYVSPKALVLPAIKVSQVAPKKVVFDPRKDAAPEALKPLAQLPPPQITEPHVQLTHLIEISPDEYKMIQALLLLEYQKKYDMAMSLLADIVNSNSKLKLQALYHYAQVALHFDLKNEFKTRMTQVMRNTEDLSLRKKAIESLVTNAIAILPEDTASIDNEISKSGIRVNYSDYYLLRKGKYLVTQGDLNSAASALGSIGNTSKAFVESRLLLSNVNYRLGDVNAAIKNLESAVPKLSSERTEKFRNLTYLTLARLYFQKGNYKQSYAHFLNIDKSSSYWLQSTTEQALTQIMAGDYIGAAGNMFSLHTEYFKKAYAPESYLIRAVGYLNLCQFGDSVSVVNELQRRYSKVSEQIQSFQSQNKNSSDYYGLIKELFAKSDAPDIKGVPKPFLIELARHPSYIGIQKRINSYEDEVARFSTVANNLANKAASLRQQIAAAKNESNALKNKVASTMLMEQQQRKVLTLESQLSMALNGREKIEKMKSQAAERLIGEKGKLKVLAGEVLQKRYAVAAKELTETLEQKDVLAYEVYSGAGEHIRYQMAGGESKERLPATALTPEEKQSYKWKFKGEVWEDEIGHYRSSLTNVCAKDDFAKNTGGK
jgi:hypothetical protein